MELCPYRDQQLMARCGDQIKTMKEDFIIAHFAPFCHCCRKYIINKNKYRCDAKKLDLCQDCYERESALTDISERYAFNKSIWNTGMLKCEYVPEQFPLITDNDKKCDTDIFSTRMEFLSLCQGNHYQFDQVCWEDLPYALSLSPSLFFSFKKSKFSKNRNEAKFIVIDLTTTDSTRQALIDDGPLSSSQPQHSLLHGDLQ